jgi:hypothetical protein
VQPKRKIARKEARMSRRGNSGETKQKSSITIIAALIGTAGTIVAAVIGVLATRPATGQPDRSPVAQPSSSHDVVSFCTLGDRRYEAAPLNPSPPAAEIGVTPIVAYFFLDRATSPPEINASGRIEGEVPPDMNLWLVDHPKANTSDSTPEHNHGSNRYYPIGKIKPTASGCWSTPPHSIGYDEALGITFEHIFMLVPDSTQAEFITRPKEDKRFDGFDPSLASRPDIRILGAFDVTTSP